MTTFDKRDRDFENRYAHEEELSFKINARRNKLVGLWAAEKLGKTGNEAEEYAKEAVMVEFESSGHDDVAEKLLKDFEQAGVKITVKEIRAEMERLLAIAKKEIMGDQPSGS